MLRGELTLCLRFHSVFRRRRKASKSLSIWRKGAFVWSRELTDVTVVDSMVEGAGALRTGGRTNLGMRKVTVTGQSS